MPLVDKDIAYFLHQTPYRDNSALVHLLTRENGKVSFIVGGLKAKKHGKRAFLQPCRLLQIDYQLKSQLSKLEHIDFMGGDDNSLRSSPDISHFLLYQYANELLLTVLPGQLPVPTIFDDYTEFLQLLTQSRPHASLRYIELALITLSAGLPSLTQTQDTALAIQADNRYYFYAERGLFTLAQHGGGAGIQLGGAQIHAFTHIADAYIHGHFEQINEDLAQGAKALTACLIQHLLGHKTLKTREVYHDLQAYI